MKDALPASRLATLACHLGNRSVHPRPGRGHPSIAVGGDGPMPDMLVAGT